MIDQKEKGKPQKMLYDQATKRGGCKLLGKLYCGKIVHQEKILHLQFTAKKDRKLITKPKSNFMPLFDFSVYSIF